MRVALLAWPMVGLLLLGGPATRAADDVPPAYDWHGLDHSIGTAGVLHDDVYTYTLPRADLDVAVDGMAVPAAAGICVGVPLLPLLVREDPRRGRPVLLRGLRGQRRGRRPPPRRR